MRHGGRLCHKDYSIGILLYLEETKAVAKNAVVVIHVYEDN